MLRHQKADQRRDADRRQAGGRIAADDQLETVERAGERRTERAGNAGGGAATDQDAQVAAAQAKGVADARGDAAGDLGVAGFQSDRGADAARPHGLRRDDHAADERHAAAVQRIGFDRIDLALRPPPGDHFAGDTEYDAAGERHQNRQPRIERQPPRQPLARRQLEEHLVKDVDADAHAGHDRSAKHADQGRQQDQARFSRPHDGAQAPRNLQSGGSFSNQGASPAEPY